MEGKKEYWNPSSKDFNEGHLTEEGKKELKKLNIIFQDISVCLASISSYGSRLQELKQKFSKTNL